MMTPAEAFMAAKHRGLSDHLALWTAVAAARQADPDPMICGLHNVPSTDELYDQAKRDLPEVRREVAGLCKERSL